MRFYLFSCYKDEIVEKGWQKRVKYGIQMPDKLI